jgi:hypothetical protein
VFDGFSNKENEAIMGINEWFTMTQRENEDHHDQVVLDRDNFAFLLYRIGNIVVAGVFTVHSDAVQVMSP